MIKIKRTSLAVLFSLTLLSYFAFAGVFAGGIQHQGNYSRGIEYIYDINDIDELSDYENSCKTDEDSYSMQNIEPFMVYLNELGYDFADSSTFQTITDNFDSLYDSALNLGVIIVVENDALFKVFMPKEEQDQLISPAFSAGKTLDTENGGTHQVITKEALDVVMDYFPDFFLTNESGVPYVQMYSDYPDIYECGLENRVHYYNYITKNNLFGGVIPEWNSEINNTTAKDMFFEHYQEAISCYSTNRILAFKHLGAAIHYLQDIAAPPHVGNGVTPSNSSDYILRALLFNPAWSILEELGIRAGHARYEEYVDARDRYIAFKIPSSINYDYYCGTSWSMLIEQLAFQSYSNYELSKGTESEMYEAALQMLPLIKEIVAGLLYSFAMQTEGSSFSEYSQVLLRNKVSSNYIAKKSGYANPFAHDLELGNIKNATFFSIRENTSEKLNTRSVSFAYKDTELNYLGVTSQGRLQLQMKNGVANQNFEIANSTQGHQVIRTGASDYQKALYALTASASLGDVVTHKSLGTDNSQRWCIDVMKDISVSEYSTSKHSVSLHKDQWSYLRFTVETPGYYVFKTESYLLDTKISLYDNKFNLINNPQGDDNLGDGLNARAEQMLIEGEYYLKIEANNDFFMTVPLLVEAPVDNNHLVQPLDYGYPQVYVTSRTTTPIVSGNYTITTHRLRTGFISGEYLVLSPRKQDAGIAYLEYELPVAVHKINIELALWSEKEYLRSSDCTANIEVMNANGDWESVLDLLDDITLTTDKQNPINYSVAFEYPTKHFRVNVTSPAVGASNNTGRLCVGNLMLHFRPDGDISCGHYFKYNGQKHGSSGHGVTCSLCSEDFIHDHKYVLINDYYNCTVCGYIFPFPIITDPLSAIIPAILDGSKITIDDFLKENNESRC